MMPPPSHGPRSPMIPPAPAQSSRRRAWIATAALAAVIALPVAVSGQESLLPEGFGDPAPKSAPTPKAAPTPTPSPAPASTADGSSSSPAPTAPTESGGTRPAATGTATRTASVPEGTDPIDPDAVAPGTLRYDLPPGSRRLLSRVGPLTPETGGVSSMAFGTAGGAWLMALMERTRAPVASRWGSMLLRRVLLSGVDTPEGANGADFVAARAAMLLRMGEAADARLLVQSVDHDRMSNELIDVAMTTYLANADPAGLCPIVPVAAGRTKDARWQLASAMCSAMTAEPGPAGATLDRARRNKSVDPFDALLAQKVLGASTDGRRSVTLEWDDVDRITPWRFGIATATGSAIPDPLRNAMPDAMRSWATLAPMTPLAQRVDTADHAAARGVLSHSAYATLVALAAVDESRTPAVTELADQVQDANAAGSASARLTAMRALWGETGADPYGRLVLTARAAASLPVTNDLGADADRVVASMLSGGYDRRALAWVPAVTVGSRAWGLLAVGLPRPLNDVTADTVDDYAGNDDSRDGHRTALLAAALAGLGRLPQEDVATLDEDLSLGLSRGTRWSRAIADAAARGDQGTVALLAAVGMQGTDWARMPARHLFHIVRGLRAVGFEAEARMIAAEALTRA